MTLYGICRLVIGALIFQVRAMTFHTIRYSSNLVRGKRSYIAVQAKEHMYQRIPKYL